MGVIFSIYIIFEALGVVQVYGTKFTGYYLHAMLKLGKYSNSIYQGKRKGCFGQITL